MSVWARLLGSDASWMGRRAGLPLAHSGGPLRTISALGRPLTSCLGPAEAAGTPQRQGWLTAGCRPRQAAGRQEQDEP